MEDILVWLKTSFPGIIILGALGSLAAAMVIYVVTNVIPKALGFGESHFIGHKEVLNRVFQKQQHHLLITYFMYHMTYFVSGVVFGAGLCFWAYWFMYDGEHLEYSWPGILLLSGGFFFLGNAMYHSFFIERAYKEKLLPLLKEAASTHQAASDDG